MLLAVDGLSGTNKGRLCNALAKKWELKHLDSGLLYRMVTLCLLEGRLSSLEMPELEKICFSVDFSEEGMRLAIDHEDASSRLRTAAINAAVAKVAAQPQVRSFVAKCVRKITAEGDYIVDGRDTGANLVPQADVKFFLYGSVEFRVRQILSGGFNSNLYETLTRCIEERDSADILRPFNGVRCCDDAIVIFIDGFTFEQLLQTIEKYVSRFVADGLSLNCEEQKKLRKAQDFANWYLEKFLCIRAVKMAIRERFIDDGEDFHFLAAGTEGITLRRGEVVYKLLRQPLVCKALLDTVFTQETPSVLVPAQLITIEKMDIIRRPFIAGSPYRGGHVEELIQLARLLKRHGLVFWDLKPANFLIVNGRLKLIDYGNAFEPYSDKVFRDNLLKTLLLIRHWNTSPYSFAEIGYQIDNGVLNERYFSKQDVQVLLNADEEIAYDYLRAAI